MATQALEPGQQSDPGGKSRKRKVPHAFGASMPIVLIGLFGTALGFFPTFFSRLGEVDTAHLVHGWTMTGWLVLVLAQILLARSRKYALHRTLGWASVVLFAAMLATSMQMVALMMSGQSRLPFDMAKFFGYSDLFNTPLLLFMYGGAIYWRKDRYLHSRLMSATVLTSIVPALARAFNIAIWRSLEGLYHAMHPTYLLILAVLGIAILRDRAAGKLRWPLPLAFGWFCALYATQWPIMQVDAYDRLCRAIGALA